MVPMVRIDDRLIHGQVAVLWSKELNVNRIIVANDQIAKNDIQKASLKMATPATVRCSILAVDDAADVINDPRAENLRILVIVNNTKDARKICEQVKKIEKFDIGNYGLVGNYSGKKKLADTFYADQDDVNNLQAIIKLGIPSVYWLVPSSPPVELAKLLNTF